MSYDITQLLNACEAGHDGALNDLYEVIYQQLHQIARQQLRRSWSMETICTTVLVNESYLKLLGNQQLSFVDRAHFYAVAAKAMRQIILNYAEKKQAQKRGVDWQRVTLEKTLADDNTEAELVLAVGLAIEEVEAIDEGLARLTEMKFFAGMTEGEIAAVQGVTDRTVRRNWKKAKALLMQALS